MSIKEELYGGIPISSREQNNSFSIVLKNNTSSTILADILGSPTNLKDNANAKTSYSYNLAGETYGTNEISIQFRTTTSQWFQSATLHLNSQNIEGVVYALNQLGIGTWFVSGTSVVTYNDDYVFGQLLINSLINPSFYTGTGFDNNVYSVVVNSVGQVYCGGAFSSYNGNTANAIIKLNQDGSVDKSFITGTGFNGNVFAIAIQADGKIIVVGNFTSYNGTAANRIIRLNTDGSVDATFLYGAGFNNPVFDVKIQQDGYILVGGNFNTYDGTSAEKIVRLDPIGSIDPSSVYGTGFDNVAVRKIGIQSDGKIICGGFFTDYNGTPANCIIRLNTNGSVDGTFVYGTGFDSTVNDLFIQPDGKIVLCGAFTTYNGTGANYIIRLNANGSVDGTFVYGTGFDAQVNALGLLSNGIIIAGGFFTSYDGNASNRIISINSDGSLGSNSYGTGFDAEPYEIRAVATGGYFVAGSFTLFDGATANRIISLL